MRSLLKSTIPASTASLLVFATVLLMGFAPLWAEGPTGDQGTTGRMAPGPGKGEGVVNVPSMPEPNEIQTGAFGVNGCRVVATMTLGSSGVVLQLPAESPTVMASYMFNGVPVTTYVQAGLLHFDSGSLEALRAARVEVVDIVLAASESQYLRARLELPPSTAQVTVRIE